MTDISGDVHMIAQAAVYAGADMPKQDLFGQAGPHFHPGQAALLEVVADTNGAVHM